ncbi:MAG: DUF624 domain-containing protein [Alicyclobacillus sp.]|nr:DUF624 domain-containing protein [Alicyclobacillus sp.]
MFSMDGILYKTCNAIYRQLVLNLMFLAACLPVVTIPAAGAALFAVARKYVYKEEPPLIRTFWVAFRDNWLQASIVGYLLGLIGVVWWIDVRVLVHQRVPLGGMASIAMLFIGLILLSEVMHAYPLMVHVHATTRQILANAFKLSLFKPHLTFAAMILVGALWFISLRFSVLLVICTFSLSATVIYWFINRKFERLGVGYRHIEDEDAAGESG